MKGVNKTQKLQIDILKCSIGRGEDLARELIANKHLWQSFIIVSNEHYDNNLMLIAHDNVYLRMNAISFLVKKFSFFSTKIFKKFSIFNFFSNKKLSGILSFILIESKLE